MRASLGMRYTSENSRHTPQTTFLKNFSNSYSVYMRCSTPSTPARMPSLSAFRPGGRRSPLRRGRSCGTSCAAGPGVRPSFHHVLAPTPSDHRSLSTRHGARDSADRLKLRVSTRVKFGVFKIAAQYPVGLCLHDSVVQKTEPIFLCDGKFAPGKL